MDSFEPWKFKRSLCCYFSVLSFLKSSTSLNCCKNHSSRQFCKRRLCFTLKGTQKICEKKMKGRSPTPLGAGDDTKGREGVGVLHHPQTFGNVCQLSILSDFWRNVYLIVAILMKESRYRRIFGRLRIYSFEFRRTGSKFLGDWPSLWPSFLFFRQKNVLTARKYRFWCPNMILCPELGSWSPQPLASSQMSAEPPSLTDVQVKKVLRR